jgi:hypothetical protein
MHETKEACNADLVDFGFVLWECMEGRALTAEKRHIGWIKDQRAVNKVFGFADPERWSGCKQLIDFMDELFNEQRTALAKFSKPVC